MKVYSNEKLHEIAAENYRILCRYCSILEEEGYWEHPSSILKHSIVGFLQMYLQALMIHLAVYRKVEDVHTLQMIVRACEMNPLGVSPLGFSEENVLEATRIVTAPPILLQLCSLRDVEKHSSMTGLFFDAVLNVLFAEAYLNRQHDPAVTRYVKEYYSRIQVFIQSANTHGACVDEKYLFHKICMGDLEENTVQLQRAGEDFVEYKREALNLTERKLTEQKVQSEPETAEVGDMPEEAEKNAFSEKTAQIPEVESEVREEPAEDYEPKVIEAAAILRERRESADSDWEDEYTDDIGTEDVYEEPEEESEQIFAEEEECRAESSNTDKCNADNLSDAEDAQTLEKDTSAEEQIEVDFLAARLTKPLKEINDLVGLKEVKEEIHSLINLIRIRKMREKFQLPSLPMSYHMVFTGNPGTGKTTVARLVGKVYKELGILTHGDMIETDRAGLVAGYVGQTALKVKEVVEKAKGGILFIDEAYTLSNKATDNDFGSEAIDTLVKMMEDCRDDLVIIVAGYTKEMEQFLQANTGLQSRFNKFISFPDYSEEELLTIMDSMAEKAGFCLDEDAKEWIASYLAKMEPEETRKFGNARGIRNLFEKLVTAQANRVIQYPAPTREQLTQITKEDCIRIG